MRNRPSGKVTNETTSELAIARRKPRLSGGCHRWTGRSIRPTPARSTTSRTNGTADTDIEHIVALAEAYDSGVAESDYRTIAADIDNLTVAVPNVNRFDKGDRDAAEWQPDRNRGWYAATIVSVKHEYNLSGEPGRA